MRKFIIGAVETICLFVLTASTCCVLALRVPKPAQMRKYPLQLVVQTTKKVYRAGEPIGISGYLKNTSDGRSFYVGRELGSFCAIMSFHYIELEIIDEKYKRIPTASSAAAGAWKEGTTQREKLRQEYVLLGPKSTYEQRDSTCNISLPKGQYQLRALYHEIEATGWRGKDSGDFPVWTKPLYSNSITITVVS